MSFLNISGAVTVPVAPDGVDVEYTQVGDRARAWDGTLRTTVTGFRKTYRIRTAPMSSGTAASVVTALSCTPPLAVYGDLAAFFATAGTPELVSETVIAGGTGARYELEFRLHEGNVDTPLEWWSGSTEVYTSTGLSGVAVSTDDRVRGWVGRISSYPMIQDAGDAADAPLYSPSGMGNTNLPSVQFNARPWMYSTSSGLIANVDGSDKAWSWIGVVRITTGTNSERYFWTLRNSTTNNGLHGIGVLLSGSDLVWTTLRRQDGTASATVRSSTIVATDAKNWIVSYRFDGQNVRMWANGTLVLNSSLDVNSATFNDTILGAIDRSGNFEWDGWIAEAVYFPGIAITPDTRTAFEGLFSTYST